MPKWGEYRVQHYVLAYKKLRVPTLEIIYLCPCELLHVSHYFVDVTTCWRLRYLGTKVHLLKYLNSPRKAHRYHPSPTAEFRVNGGRLLLTYLGINLERVLSRGFNVTGNIFSKAARFILSAIDRRITLFSFI